VGFDHTLAKGCNLSHYTKSVKGISTRHFSDCLTSPYQYYNFQNRLSSINLRLLPGSCTEPGGRAKEGRMIQVRDDDTTER
jgi:hypothetical protein